MTYKSKITHKDNIIGNILKNEIDHKDNIVGRILSYYDKFEKEVAKDVAEEKKKKTLLTKE